MDTLAITAGPLECSHAEYETAFSELEQRASRGEFTLAQWRYEVQALRQRLTAGRPVSLWRRHGHVSA